MESDVMGDGSMRGNLLVALGDGDLVLQVMDQGRA
jgi:hypothetical protein